MKNIVKLTFTFLLFSYQAFSQIDFETGYFVDIRGTRTDCVIKNREWLDNPKQIKYKLLGSDNVLTIETAELREIGVGVLKYKRALVSIDYSSNDTNKLTTNKNPEWTKADLLLQVLIEGEVNLFSYSQKGIEKFFYGRQGQDTITQLIYKPYMQQPDKMAHNNTYRNQLMTNVSCGNVTSAINKMKYNKEALIKHFRAYNECKGVTQQVFIKKNRSSFNFKLTPGFDFSKMSIADSREFFSTYSHSASSFRAGAELEWILPLKKNKWALFIEPTFQSFKITEGNPITYESIEVPVALRHYFYFNPKSRVFINGGIVADLPMTYDVQYSKSIALKGSTSVRFNFAAGVGYSYSRFSIETRLYTGRNILDETNTWFLDYSKKTIILGFTLF